MTTLVAGSCPTWLEGLFVALELCPAIRALMHEFRTVAFHEFFRVAERLAEDVAAVIDFVTLFFDLLLELIDALLAVHVSQPKASNIAESTGSFPPRESSKRPMKDS